MLYKISDMLCKISFIGYKIFTKEDISFIQLNKIFHFSISDILFCISDIYINILDILFNK